MKSPESEETEYYLVILRINIRPCEDAVTHILRKREQPVRSCSICQSSYGEGLMKCRLLSYEL